MPLIHRPFTLGNLTTLTDQASAAASLVVVPMYSYAVSGSEMVTPEEETFDIEDGAFTEEHTIVAGQVYKFTLKDSGGNTILDTGPRTVSAASSASISFVEVYNSGTPPPDPVVAYVKEKDNANRLDYGAADDGDVWSYDGDTDVWGPSPAGAGDLISANNLSDLTSASTARTNLGLGTAATRNAAAAGTTGGVLNADDPATTNARTPTAHKSTHATGGADALTPGDIGAATAAALTAEASARAAADTTLQADINTRALDADLSAHTANTSNPHSVDKAQVGLSNVDNVSAANLRDRSTHTGTQTLSTISDAAAALALKTDKATLTTKGDIYVATGAGALTRLAVGADGYRLTADSAQPTGLKWANGGGGAAGGISYARIQHRTTGGTGGGNFPQSTLVVQPLNFVLNNNSTGLEDNELLSGNAITLEEGYNYDIEAYLLGQGVNQHVAFLVLGADTFLVTGSLEQSSPSAPTRARSVIDTDVDVPSGGGNVTIHFQRLCVTTHANGFGDPIWQYVNSNPEFPTGWPDPLPGNFEQVNLYSWVDIKRRPLT